MTTPEANAFMRQLDQDPELLEQVRARILTRELLQLPETVAQLASTQQEMAGQLDALQDTQHQTNQHLGAVEETLQEFQQETNQRLGAVEETLQEFQQETNQRLGAVEETLQEFQQETNQRLGTLEETQQQTNQRLGALEETQQQTNQRLGRIEGTLGNLTGDAYENRAARVSPRFLARYLQLRRAQALQAPSVNIPNHLDDLVNEGVIDGTISDQQAQELERADIIIMAKDNENQTVYVVIEVSITVDDTDIDRAHERAQIMGRLAGMPVRPGVVGQDISPANRERADELGVAFMPLSQ